MIGVRRCTGPCLVGVQRTVGAAAYVLKIQRTANECGTLSVRRRRLMYGWRAVIAVLLSGSDRETVNTVTQLLLSIDVRQSNAVSHLF